MTNGKEIQINLSPEMQAGVYANNMFVTHTKEEFMVDFIFMDPQMGSVVSRVVTSPGHMKRIVSALKDNLDKYERSIGEIEIAPAPEGGKVIGFKPPKKND